MRKEKERRNEEIVNLRDKGIKFYAIAKRYDITTSRAHQIYHEMSRISRPRKVHLTLNVEARTFGDNPDKLELVIPRQSVIMRT